MRSLMFSLLIIVGLMAQTSSAAFTYTYTYVSTPEKRAGATIASGGDIYSSNGTLIGQGLALSAGVSSRVSTMMSSDFGYAANEDNPATGQVVLMLGLIDIPPTVLGSGGLDFEYSDSQNNLWMRMSSSNSVTIDTSNRPPVYWSVNNQTFQIRDAVQMGSATGSFTSSYAPYDGHTYDMLVVSQPIMFTGPNAVQMSLALDAATPDIVVPEPGAVGLLGLLALGLRRKGR
jgi:MYXO-CTERM domain-containing protein